MFSLGRSKLARKILKRYEEESSEKTPASKDDLKVLAKELQRGNSDLLRKQSQPTTGQTALRVVKMAARGFSNINKSLSHSYDPRRPKIAQLPRRREDMGIVSDLYASLEGMKPPNMRDRDITGRKIKK